MSQHSKSKTTPSNTTTGARLQRGCSRMLLLSKQLIVVCRSSSAPCKRGPWGIFIAFLSPRSRTQWEWTRETVWPKCPCNWPSGSDLSAPSCSNSGGGLNLQMSLARPQPSAKAWRSSTPGSKARCFFCPSPRSKYVAQH